MTDDIGEELVEKLNQDKENLVDAVCEEDKKLIKQAEKRLEPLHQVEPVNRQTEL